jgi:hypothetical protein
VLTAGSGKGEKGHLGCAVSAAVAWAGMTRSPEFGQGCFQQVGWPEFGEMLVASGTLPAYSED